MYLARAPQVRVLLLIVAVVLFVIFGLIGAGWITSTHPDAFLGFGAACFAASFI